MRFGILKILNCIWRTPSGGSFADFINKFLRLKQQPDGWPDWTNTDEDKDREYEEQEGMKFLLLKPS